MLTTTKLFVFFCIVTTCLCAGVSTLECEEKGPAYSCVETSENCSGVITDTCCSGKLCCYDPCSLQPCNNSCVCSVLDNSYQCDCVDGFTGQNCDQSPCECPDGFQALPGIIDKCYRVDLTGSGFVMWPSANMTCSSYNSRLLQPENAAEVDAVYQFVSNISGSEFTNFLWTSANDRNMDGRIEFEGWETAPIPVSQFPPFGSVTGMLTTADICLPIKPGSDWSYFLCEGLFARYACVYPLMTCSSYNSRLLQPENAAEVDAVYQFVSNISGSEFTNFLWTSANDRNMDGRIEFEGWETAPIPVSQFPPFGSVTGMLTTADICLPIKPGSDWSYFLCEGLFARYACVYPLGCDMTV